MIQGKPGLLLALAADDVQFDFPGTSSFAASLQSKNELRAWLERFVSLKPEFVIHDVAVTGPPWNTRAAVQFSDRIGTDYDNEGAEFIVMRWGKVRSVRVFLDTERISAWESRHPELVAG